MSVDAPEPTAGGSEALRRIDALLQRRFGGMALDRRFDERVLARVGELDVAQIAARRAQAEREFEGMSSTLARHWRSARDVLIAKLAAFIAVALAAGVVVLNAWSPELTGIAENYVGGSAAQLPWIVLGTAVAASAFGWGVSTRVKL